MRTEFFYVWIWRIFYIYTIHMCRVFWVIAFSPPLKFICLLLEPLDKNSLSKEEHIRVGEPYVFLWYPQCILQHIGLIILNRFGHFKCSVSDTWMVLFRDVCKGALQPVHRGIRIFLEFLDASFSYCQIFVFIVPSLKKDSCAPVCYSCKQI